MEGSWISNTRSLIVPLRMGLNGLQSLKCIVQRTLGQEDRDLIDGKGK